VLGVVVIMCCLQDEDSLYMGLEYCPNGELYSQLQERGPLPVTDAVQYAAEIVDILAYLR
jgi:3-phosphoinositide dependent protein kinase-1